MPRKLYKKCPICRSRKIALYKKQIWDDSRRAIYKCQSCQIYFLNPAMTDEEIVELYNNYIKYSQERERADWVSSKFKSQQGEEARRRFRLLKKYFKGSDTLCDLGASFGQFLELGRPFIHKVIAVEPMPAATKVLNQKKILNFKWLHEVDETIKFDVLSMFHLIEHLNDPITYLNDIKTHLQKGARIFVETPSLDDALLGLYKNKSFMDFYFRKEHCFYYTEATLNALFKKAGFKNIDNIRLQRYGIANHLTWAVYNHSGSNDVFEKLFCNMDKQYRDMLIKNKMNDTILSVYKYE